MNHYLTSALPNEGEYRYFRRSFELENVPGSVVLSCNGTGHFGVWINGTFIGAHPGRHPGRIWKVEIGDKLHRGNNLIAVQLGGSIFQAAAVLDYPEFAMELTVPWTEGKPWRCSGAHSNGWEKSGFDDGNWTAPIKTVPVSAAEYEQLWKTAPLWKSCALPEANAVCTDNIADFGGLAVGFTKLTFREPAYGTLLLKFDIGSRRTDLEETERAHPHLNKLSVRIELKGETEYLLLRRRACRYLSWAGDCEKAVESVAILQCAYPAISRGEISTSDQRLNEISRVAEKTLRVNMQLEYESCPRHEMLEFAGDVRLDALMSAYRFGDYALTKAFFSHIHCMDLIHVPGRVYDELEERSLWDYPAWWNICLYEYGLFSGDLETLRRHYPVAALNAKWYENKLNEDGLIFQRSQLSRHHDTPTVIEYSCSQYRVGPKAFLNALTAHAFEITARLAELCSPAETSRWRDNARKAADGLNKFLWDERTGTYKDALSDALLQDANVLAVLFDLAPPERAQRALDAIRRNLWCDAGTRMTDTIPRNQEWIFGPEVVSPFMCTYECAARFQLGQSKEALDLMRRCWGAMLDKNADTFWEYNACDPKRFWTATAHAWSAGPLWLFGAYVLGIRPLELNWRRIIVAPQPGDLDKINGTVPTPHGDIKLDCAKNGDVFHGSLTLPEGIESVEFSFPGFELTIENCHEKTLTKAGTYHFTAR